MLISVIVPIYKVEKFIEQCISSIVNQTYRKLEIILVDDGSPDNCPNICDNWAKKDERIKVVHKENGGLVSARKAGLAVASGDYIVNVDGDDFIGETLIESIYNCATKNNLPEIIAFNFLHYFPERNVSKNNTYEEGLYVGEQLKKIKEEILYNKNAPSLNLGGIIYSIWSKAFKKEVIQQVQFNVPNEITKGEDVAVTVPAIMNCSNIFIANFNQYFYRANPCSMINTYNYKEVKQLIVLFDYLHRVLGTSHDNQICVYVFFMCFNYVVKAAKSKSSYKEFRQIINEAIDGSLFAQIKRAKVYRPTLKDRIIIFMMKNKLYRLIYIYFKLKV